MRCLKEPIISGDIKLSKGILSLQYGALSTPSTSSDAVSTTNGSASATPFKNIKIGDFQMPDNFPFGGTSPFDFKQQVNLNLTFKHLNYFINRNYQWMVYISKICVL